MLPLWDGGQDACTIGQEIFGQELHINALELTAVLLAIQTFTKERIFGKNRQYYSQVLHQSYRGNLLSNSQCNSFEHMELVPRASPSFVSRVPPRSGEPDSGCRVQTLGRSLRLDASSTSVRADKQLNGSTGCGSLCVQANAPITKVFQLEARPGSGSHTQNWSQIHGYANPPWCLILTALNKIRREEARIVLLAPVWKTQP